MTFISKFQAAELLNLHTKTLEKWTNPNHFKYQPDFPVHWLDHPKRRIFIKEEILEYLEKGREQKKRV